MLHAIHLFVNRDIDWLPIPMLCRSNASLFIQHAFHGQGFSCHDHLKNRSMSLQSKLMGHNLMLDQMKGPMGLQYKKKKRSCTTFLQITVARNVLLLLLLLFSLAPGDIKTDDQCKCIDKLECLSENATRHHSSPQTWQIQFKRYLRWVRWSSASGGVAMLQKYQDS